MTINEIISLADKYRPGNRYDNDLKTRWIYEIDSMVFDEYVLPKMNRPGRETTVAEEINPLNMDRKPQTGVFRKELKPYNYETDNERKVLLPERFSDVYVQYIKAKMDAEDGETDEYNNSVILYQAALDEFSGWFIRNYGSCPSSGFIF